MSNLNKDAILEILSPNSKRLYFIFGGLAAGMGMPPFEFYNASKILEENKIFLRDFSQSWYQKGLPEIGSDLIAIKNFAQKKIEAYKPSEVYFVGNSMGGFAAILLGAMLNTGTTIAFAPQTFISIPKRLRYLDYRWLYEITKTHLTTQKEKRIFDLERYLHANPSPNNTIHILVSKNDRLDIIHANQLEKFQNTNIHIYQDGGHELVRYLRNQGVLPNILLGKFD